MPNLIDRIIGAFNPVAGVRRHMAREVLGRAYEAASKKDGWKPRRPGASANTDHQMDAATIRIRARALVQNVPYIARGLGSLTANVIRHRLYPAQPGQKCRNHRPALGRLDQSGRRRWPA